MTKVLIVEDELDLSRVLRLELEFEKFEVKVANNGIDGLVEAISGDYDIILLDLMLPGVDGLEITRQIRNLGKTCYIIMMTAKDSSDEVIYGLEQGADDYLKKPFSFGELLARIRVLLRRREMEQNAHNASPEVKLAQKTIPDTSEIALDEFSKSVQWKGKLYKLSQKEFNILDYLVAHKNQVISREELFEQIWKKTVTAKNLHIVDVYISYIRKKIEKGIILSVRGKGYSYQE